MDILTVDDQNRKVMDMAKVGVEQSLTDVQNALADKGYDVVPMKNEGDAKGCDCCVISGQDENVMGIQNVATNGPVIDARGMNAEEICKQVESRVR
jgi:hypothetical protein